jgi:hypothetical protein
MTEQLQHDAALEMVRALQKIEEVSSDDDTEERLTRLVYWVCRTGIERYEEAINRKQREIPFFPN